MLFAMYLYASTNARAFYNTTLKRMYTDVVAYGMAYISTSTASLFYLGWFVISAVSYRLKANDRTHIDTQKNPERFLYAAGYFDRKLASYLLCYCIIDGCLAATRTTVTFNSI